MTQGRGNITEQRYRGGSLPFDCRNRPLPHQTFRSIAVQCSSIRHRRDRDPLAADKGYICLKRRMLEGVLKGRIMRVERVVV